MGFGGGNHCTIGPDSGLPPDADVVGAASGRPAPGPMPERGVSRKGKGRRVHLPSTTTKTGARPWAFIVKQTRSDGGLAAGARSKQRQGWGIEVFREGGGRGGGSAGAVFGGGPGRILGGAGNGAALPLTTKRGRGREPMLIRRGGAWRSLALGLGESGKGGHGRGGRSLKGGGLGWRWGAIPTGAPRPARLGMAGQLAGWFGRRADAGLGFDCRTSAKWQALLLGPAGGRAGGGVPGGAFGPPGVFLFRTSLGPAGPLNFQKNLRAFLCPLRSRGGNF